MATYEIQILTTDGWWTNDASMLGHGANQSDNQWLSEAEATAAMDELASIGGLDQDRLRVAEID